jgi:hypothetical protein
MVDEYHDRFIEGGQRREEEAIHRPAGSLCFPSGGAGNVGDGYLVNRSAPCNISLLTIVQ